MKVLLLTQYFTPEVGAAPTRLWIWVKELQRHGLALTVVAPVPNYPEGRIHSDYQSRIWARESLVGITVLRCGLIPGDGKGLRRLLCYLSFCFTSLTAIWRAERPHIIVVNSGPLFLMLPARILAWWWGSTLVMIVADLWPRSVQHLGALGGVNRWALRWAERLEKWSYQQADFVSAVTEGVLQALRAKAVPEHKLQLLPNGVDEVGAQAFFAKLPMDPLKTSIPRSHEAQSLRASWLKGREGTSNATVILYAGNHGHAHDLERVLQVAEKLRGSNLVWIFVGGGAQKRELEASAAEKQLQGVVQFYSPVSPVELRHWISACDLGLIHLADTDLASETRPAKLFPLFEGRKPILYVGRGEGAQLVVDSGAGWVLPPAQPNEFVSGVQAALSQQSSWESKGMSGWLFAKEKLSAQRWVANWWRDLLQRRDQSPALFLDRDGVVLEWVDFIDRKDQVRLQSGIVSLISRARTAGFRVFLITNQSGIGRGRFSWHDYEQVTQRMQDLLAEQGQWLDGIFCASENPESLSASSDGASFRRKPSPKMVEEAQKMHRLDLSRSVFVGDTEVDLQCGSAAGVGRLYWLQAVGSKPGEVDFSSYGATRITDLARVELS